MADEAQTSPDDVRRYVDTDADDQTINEFIDDAEGEALTWNDVDDFHDQSELDRLVKFYTAYLMAKPADSSGDVKQLARGGRSVTLKTPGENDRRWILRRIRANDPSGKVLSGRAGVRHHTTAGGGGYLDDDTYPDRGPEEVEK